MHTHHELSGNLQTGLGVFYFLVALMNFGFAAYMNKQRNRPQMLLWTVVAGIFLLHSFAYFLHLGWTLSPAIKGFVDGIMNPVSYFVISVAALAALLIWRRFLTEPAVAWTILNVSLLFSGWAMTDDNFKDIITKPDNVPIVMLIFSVGYTTWLALRRAVLNDDRMRAGQPPMEKLEDEKVLVWPDLVYTELIAMVICTFILVVWAVYLKAPLEQPASSARIPNPSKAPWYFLGLQEMLVYFDPWIAGVVLPTLIIIGLIIIPYVDVNPLGNGYYTYKQRKFAIWTFLFGFLILWVFLVFIGTFIRGPGWLWFWPGEFWDHHRVVHEVNRDLHDIIAGWFRWDWLTRQPGKGIFGALVVGGYFAVGMGIFHVLFKKLAANAYRLMNIWQYLIVNSLFVMMMGLPVKIIARLVFRIKYVMVTPWFNI